MLTKTRNSSIVPAEPAIRLNTAAPPVAIPPGHVGPVFLPGSGRLIWWTGRVAIGLRHEPERHHDMPSQSSLWLQDLMLSRRGSLQAA